jgi:hypothetical protein
MEDRFDGIDWEEKTTKRQKEQPEQGDPDRKRHIERDRQKRRRVNITTRDTEQASAWTVKLAGRRKENKEKKAKTSRRSRHQRQEAVSIRKRKCGARRLRLKRGPTQATTGENMEKKGGFCPV